MIQAGDYIRDDNGQLHLVQVVGIARYYTLVMPGSGFSSVEKGKARKVKELSILPGYPEVVGERAA